jgi:hypothetical protein
MFQRVFKKNQNTDVMFNNFSRTPYRLWDNVEKYCTAGQATDDNMAQAHWMQDTKSYKHALRICNNYCFSTATMVTGTCLRGYAIGKFPVLCLLHPKERVMYSPFCNWSHLSVFGRKQLYRRLSAANKREGNVKFLISSECE